MNGLNETKRKVITMLQTPPEKRTGTAGYLVEQWHKVNDGKMKLDSIVAKMEHDLAEARSQQLKAAGAMEHIERMLGEFAEPSAPKGAEPAPMEVPVPPEARRNALLEAARSGKIVRAAQAPQTPPVEPEDQEKGEPS